MWECLFAKRFAFAFRVLFCLSCLCTRVGLFVLVSVLPCCLMPALVGTSYLKALTGTCASYSVVTCDGFLSREGHHKSTPRSCAILIPFQALQNPAYRDIGSRSFQDSYNDGFLLDTRQVYQAPPGDLEGSQARTACTRADRRAPKPFFIKSAQGAA